MKISRKGRDRSEEDIIKLVDRVRNSKCEFAFERIQLYLQQYVTLFSRRYRIPGCDQDEIEQECLFALRYKAIEDFDSERGKFKSFAILCIKRHLFSLIKGNNQQKRKVLNESLSLDQDRSEDNDSLSLSNLVTKDALTVDEELERFETFNAEQQYLLSHLSELEQEVFKSYLQQNSYKEMVDELKYIFPNKKITKKTIDNALVRLKQKAQDPRFDTSQKRRRSKNGEEEDG